MSVSPKPLRIAVGGFMHETNTFALQPTSFEDFALTQQYPGLCSGAAMLAALEGRNLAAAGFIEVARAQGHEILPLSWCFAQPGGTVSDAAFERIAAKLLAPIEALEPDAVFIELHGAMVTESFADAEGELLRRIRAIIGRDAPLLASLDLHGNISRRSVETAHYMTGYREYPHNDWGEAGRRAARDLPRVLAWGAQRAAAFERFDALIPITAQSTYTEPARGLYARLKEIEAETGVALSLMMGFPPADIADCGPCVFGYGGDRQSVEDAVAQLSAALRAAEPVFAGHRVLPQQDAIREALQSAPNLQRPVIIADTEDNPGAGSPSSTTGMARELLAQGATNSIVAICHEPEVAAQAHAAGVGQVVAATLGRHVDGPGQEALSGAFKVAALSDGKFAGTGPMLGGAMVDMGPTAVLEIAGVKLLVASKRQQPLSRAVFEHLGIDPSKLDIIVLKSSVHYRNHFEEIAGRIIVAASPGANPADPAGIAYKNMPAAMRRSLRSA